MRCWGSDLLTAHDVALAGRAISSLVTWVVVAWSSVAVHDAADMTVAQSHRADREERERGGKSHALYPA
jgi:hypothetical protein